MTYAERRKDPQYLKHYRELLREAHIYGLRGRGIPCACVACGVTIEETALSFLLGGGDVAPFRELLRRADFASLLAACEAHPLVCGRCRSNWRAGLRREFPAEWR